LAKASGGVAYRLEFGGRPDEVVTVTFALGGTAILFE
jgi:hypothetical protein